MISKEDFLETVKEMAESVYDFHDRFEIDSHDLTVFEVLNQRVLLQCEEVGELCRALNKGMIDNAFEEAADALYIALGTIVSSSYFGLEACKQVAEKNNNKTPDNCTFSATGKIVKK